MNKNYLPDLDFDKINSSIESQYWNDKKFYNND